MNLNRLLGEPFFDEEVFKELVAARLLNENQNVIFYKENTVSDFHPVSRVGMLKGIFDSKLGCIYFPDTYCIDLQENILAFEYTVLDTVCIRTIGYNHSFFPDIPLNNYQKIDFLIKRGRSDIIPFMKQYKIDRNILDLLKRVWSKPSHEELKEAM